MNRASFFAAIVLVIAPGWLPGQSFDTAMDALETRLSFSNADASIRAALGGTLDLEAYTFEGDPPGLLRTDENWLIQPRAVFHFDIQAGPTLYGFAQARIDTGFDPSDRGAEARLDEYALRYTPWENGRLSLQAGQFATIIGRWVNRHLSWQNPFITAPLLYENPTRLSDLYPPYSARYLTYPREGSGYNYNPVIWGPAYATGMAAAGRWNAFEWAVELKNAAPMARPEYWTLSGDGFDEPTVAARLGWRPDLRWDFGVSVVEGVYAGRREAFAYRGDYRQSLFLADLSYAHRHFQFWAEYALAEFTMPGLAQDLRVHTWFVEGRYKLAPRLALAIRFNEQRFSQVRSYGETLGRWGDNLRRLDFSVTWRFNAHTQLQVEADHYWSASGERDGFVLAARATLRF